MPIVRIPCDVYIEGDTPGVFDKAVGRKGSVVYRERPGDRLETDEIHELIAFLTWLFRKGRLSPATKQEAFEHRERVSRLLDGSVD